MTDDETPDEATDEATETAPAAVAPTKGRRWTARGIILLATLLATLSVFATWARQQLLNTDQWVKTSTELLEDKAISDEVAGFLVDQLYANVNVSQELSDQLPPDLQPLAPVASAAARQGLDRVSTRALQNARIQGLWANANRAAHEKFVAIVLDEKTKNADFTNGVVTLDLRGILVDIGQQIGIPDGVLAKIPASAGSIEVVRSDELKTAQTAAKLLKTGSYVLTILALALLILAVWLDRGERRSAMLLAGWGLVAAGVIVLLARRLIGTMVVGDLATTASVQGAANDAWDIGTSLLKTLGWQAVIVGFGVVVAAWLGGPSRAATAVRRFSAPGLQRRPDLVGIGVGVALLVVIAWAPIPALRRPLFVLLLIVLVALGVWVLRRQTEREFPDASDVGIDMTGWRERMSGVASGAKRTAGAAAAKVSGGGDTAVLPAADPSTARIDQLERLGKLHDSGVIDDDEFAAEKARLLQA